MTAARERMLAETFSDAGLLYYVNSTVLWPLGLTLAVDPNADGSLKKKLLIFQIEPPEVVVDTSVDVIDHPRYRAARWIADRLNSMPDSDRQLGFDILRDPNRVSAFLVPDPDANRHALPSDEADQ